MTLQEVRGVLLRVLLHEQFVCWSHLPDPPFGKIQVVSNGPLQIRRHIKVLIWHRRDGPMARFKRARKLRSLITKRLLHLIGGEEALQEGI